LTGGLQKDFDSLVPMGTKEVKAGIGDNSIFEEYSNGVKTNRDIWVYNFSLKKAVKNVKKTIEFYNEHVYKPKDIETSIDNFVINDDSRISWSEGLKNNLKNEIVIEFDNGKVTK
jgi:predicted helicase